MNPLLSPDLTNALTDSVIDAAKAAGLPVPSTVSRLHSNGSPHHPNLWHRAQGAANRDTTIAPSYRKRALADLKHLTDWAVSLRDSAPVQASLTHERGQQQRHKAATSTAAGKSMAGGMNVAMAIDDAIKLFVLEKVFEEPKIARANIQADLAKHDDPAAVIAQLERTPDVYGEVLGNRRFGTNSGTRHNALVTIREQMVRPIKTALAEAGASNPAQPRDLPDPAAPIRVNHHLLAFDDRVTKLAETHAALMRTDIERDIQEQPAGGYWAGHAGPPKRRPGA
ncbi:MAG: hypothetical protein KI792_01415 [Alphaproteobacteria bacterium]|nr:hypothetical protein [Alphaproteobacteria bacterium SS10]